MHAHELMSWRFHEIRHSNQMTRDVIFNQQRVALVTKDSILYQ
jgi:hypothetical protein